MSEVAGTLSDEQLRFFDEEGYLVLEPFLTDEDIQPVISEISAEIDLRVAEAMRAGELSQSYEEYDFEHRLAMITRETTSVYRHIMAGRLSGAGIFGMLASPRMLDIAEQLCGPELIASSVYRLRPKIPGHQWGEVPWHQDSGYFEPYCDRYRIITCWIPLIDADEERGCMWVLPRGHRDGVVKHVGTESLGYLKINQEDLPAGKPVCCPVRRGGAFIVNNITPHASFENRSDVIRWSMDFRYQSVDAPTNAHSHLAGFSAHAHADDAPVACYPPERDFLVRSKLHPEQVIRSSDEFNRLRQEHVKREVTDRWGTRPVSGAAPR